MCQRFFNTKISELSIIIDVHLKKCFHVQTLNPEVAVAQRSLPFAVPKKGAPEVRSFIRTPDIDRPDNKSRVLRLPTDRVIDKDEVDPSLPWVTLTPFRERQKPVSVPALVEVRAVLEDLKTTGPVPLGSWVISAGPKHPKILDKMRDEKGMKARLEPLLNLLILRGAKVSAGFSIFFCPVRKGGDTDTPFIEIDFWSENRTKVDLRNQEIATRRAIPNWFRALFGFPATFPPEYTPFDHWHSDEAWPVIESALRTRGGDFAESLWNAWLVGDVDATSALRLQGVNLGGFVPTQFDRLAGQRPKASNHTLYFR